MFYPKLSHLLALSLFFNQSSFTSAPQLTSVQPAQVAGNQEPPQVQLTPVISLGPKQHSSSSLSTQGAVDALDAAENSDAQEDSDAQRERIEKERQEQANAVRLKAERCTKRKYNCGFVICFGVLAACIYAIARPHDSPGSTDTQCAPSTMPFFDLNNTIDMQDSCWDLELRSSAANVSRSCLCPVEGIDNSTALRAWTMAHLMTFQALNGTSIKIRPNMKPCTPFNGCADAQQTVAQIKNSFRNVPAAQHQKTKNKFKHKKR